MIAIVAQFCLCVGADSSIDTVLTILQDTAMVIPTAPHTATAILTDTAVAVMEAVAAVATEVVLEATECLLLVPA